MDTFHWLALPLLFLLMALSGCSPADDDGCGGDDDDDSSPAADDDNDNNNDDNDNNDSDDDDDDDNDNDNDDNDNDDNDDDDDDDDNDNDNDDNDTSTDDDSSGGDFWVYDFESDAAGQPPGVPWGVYITGNHVMNVVTLGGEHGNVFQMRGNQTEMNPNACSAFATCRWHDPIPFQTSFDLDVDVNYSTNRTSRLFFQRRNGAQLVTEWSYRLTATGEVVDAFLDRRDAIEDWSHCGTFPIDTWHTLTFSFDLDAHTSTLRIDGAATACTAEPWAVGGPGWLIGFELNDWAGHTGFAYFDNFRAYRPLGTNYDADDDNDAADDDDTAAFEWIDGDSEYQPYGQIALAFDADNQMYVSYRKRDTNVYHDCRFPNYYLAGNQSGGWVAATEEYGYCQVITDTYLYYWYYEGGGASNSLVTDADGQPYLAHHSNYYCWYEGFHGFPDTETNSAALYYVPPAGDPVGLDSVYVYTEGGYYGEIGYANDMVVDPDGIQHLIYLTYDEEYHRIVKYTRPNVPGFPTEVVSSVDWSMWFVPLELAVDSTDRPHAVYYVDPNLVHAWRESDADGWQSETIDTETYGAGFDLAIDAADALHVTYTKSGDLYRAVDDGAGWTTGRLFDSAEYSYYDTYLELDVDGAEYVLFADNYPDDCKFGTNRSGDWEFYQVALPWDFLSASAALEMGTGGVLHLVIAGGYRLWHLAFPPDDLPAFFEPLEVGHE